MKESTKYFFMDEKEVSILTQSPFEGIAVGRIFKAETGNVGMPTYLITCCML